MWGDLEDQEQELRELSGRSWKWSDKNIENLHSGCGLSEGRGMIAARHIYGQHEWEEVGNYSEEGQKESMRTLGF